MGISKDNNPGIWIDGMSNKGIEGEKQIGWGEDDGLLEVLTGTIPGERASDIPTPLVRNLPSGDFCKSVKPKAGMGSSKETAWGERIKAIAPNPETLIPKTKKRECYRRLRRNSKM